MTSPNEYQLVSECVWPGVVALLIVGASLILLLLVSKAHSGNQSAISSRHEKALYELKGCLEGFGQAERNRYRKYALCFYLVEIDKALGLPVRYDLHQLWNEFQSRKDLEG